MVKAVFAYKPSSRYDDVPWQRYHFPKKNYLRKIEQTVGDFVVYYEPGRIGEGDRRGGRQAYVATARVIDIEEDRKNKEYCYARIDEETYLEFPSPVPLALQGKYLERRLQNVHGGMNRGLIRLAVRLLEEDEYELITRLGFGDVLGMDGPKMDCEGSTMELAESPEHFERSVVETLTQRPLRDRAFARRVLSAYGARCAVTGLLIRNGGGRPEAQAAHIQPVSDHGPDTIRNGLALSSTVHWMFDRGLLTLDEDYRVVSTRRGGIPPELRQWIRPGERIHVPSNPAERPHPRFLEYHRKNIFLG